MNKIIEKAKFEHILSKDEIVQLLQDESINQELFKAADSVRKEFVGDEVHLRALIEFSNFCHCNCLYCGIRAENSCVDRYRLSSDQIIQLARQAYDFGYKTVVLQSGEDLAYKVDEMAQIISEIKKLDLALTLSIGERNFEDYKILKEAGADRFLLRIETTDKDLYMKMHPKADFENRKICLFNLKKLGYEAGTGCLVGLPGQSLESLADDILFFKELDADMIGIGPLIPHHQTPLKNAENGSLDLALKVMAITRLLLPDINIPATTAMETLNPNGRIMALQSGANVIMPNITTEDIRCKYEIYPNKANVNYKQLEAKLKQIGRQISSTKGYRKVRRSL